MKVISNKKTDTNTVELEIEVSKEQLEEAVENVYQRQVKDITVPGFRKGKAPKKIIEKRFGEGVFLEEAVNDIYPDAYAKAIDETGIEPVAPGDIEIISLDENVGFTFKAIVTVKPEVSVSNYKGIKADKLVKKVTDEQVDQELDRLRERNGRLVEVEGRSAQADDTATIDFEGFHEEVAFEGGKGEDYDLVIGSNTFIPGFEEQIVDKNVGEEFDVNVTFPEEYHAEDLAGKPVVFKVALKQLKETQLPELDDEFAKDVSEFDTLDELKEDLRGNLQKMADDQAQDFLENSLVDSIIENLEGEIPEVMYEVRVDGMVQDFAQRLASQGMNLDLYLQYTGMEMADFRKTFEEQAKRQVKIRLALEKIVELENIVPTEEELEAEYEKFAEMYQMDIEKIKELIPAENITEDVANGKAIDLVRESAEVTEVDSLPEEDAQEA